MRKRYIDTKGKARENLIYGHYKRLSKSKINDLQLFL